VNTSKKSYILNKKLNFHHQLIIISNSPKLVNIINAILHINGKKVGFMKYKNALRKLDKRSFPHPPFLSSFGII
jgi:hypothetical protein